MNPPGPPPSGGALKAGAQAGGPPASFCVTLGPGPGGDCNPYLAFAATVAAGLYGIDNELELPKVFEGNMYTAKRVPDVPKTLRAALAGFNKSKILGAAFGDPVVDHYVHAGEWEQAEYDRRITDWELIRYFERA